MLRVVEGAPLSWTDKDLGSMLMARGKAHAGEPAFLVREGDAFHPWTWADVAKRVQELAAGLAALGVKPGERVAILADTRAEWALADFAIMSAGAVTVTIYPTLPRDQVRDLLDDSQSVAVFVDSRAQQEKVASIVNEAKSVRQWIPMEPLVSPLAPDAAKGAITWPALVDAGRRALEAQPQLVERRLQAIQPSDVSTVIYTSGTTGIPKGAVLTHENWTSAVESMIQVFDLRSYPDKKTVAFLPAAHVLTRLMTLTFTSLAGTIAFSSPKTFARDLVTVKPAAIVCVPRIWERMHQQIHKAVGEMPAARRRVFGRAEAVARAYGYATADGGRPSRGLRLRHALYERLVYRKLRARIGLDRLEGAMSTAVAIRPELLAFYRGIGIKVIELWGMTEMAGPGVTNTIERYKPGTVGWPIPGVAVALDEEGEICVSGPNVFAGYHERPEENAASFFEQDDRRWFRTGDVGEFDDDAALRIVDRKKEIEVLDTGKKIAPVSVEERLKGVSAFVADACLVATGRKYAGALIQADFDKLVAWAKDNGIPFDETRVVIRPDPTGTPMTYAVGEDLLAHPDVRDVFAQEVERCNAQCADFERIRTFELVPHAFTIDREELTATLKKKRRVIHSNYADAIEQMFTRP